LRIVRDCRPPFCRPGHDLAIQQLPNRRLGRPIYSSELNSQRDRAAFATRFVIPIVVNGRVYFATRGEVEVYGLLK
jgi:hypothetical protein